MQDQKPRKRPVFPVYRNGAKAPGFVQYLKPMTVPFGEPPAEMMKQRMMRPTMTMTLTMAIQYSASPK